MFLASLTYVKPAAELEKHLEAHFAFLEHYYNVGKFICSGMKQDRTGGVILFNADNEAEMRQIIEEDPFYLHDIADYTIISFRPTRCAPAFECFLEQMGRS